MKSGSGNESFRRVTLRSSLHVYVLLPGKYKQRAFLLSLRRSLTSLPLIELTLRYRESNWRTKTKDAHIAIIYATLRSRNIVADHQSHTFTLATTHTCREGRRERRSRHKQYN